MVKNKGGRFTIRVAPPANTPAILQPGQSGRFLGTSVASRAGRERKRPASALPSYRIPAVNRARQEAQDSYHTADADADYYQPPPSRRTQRKKAAQEDNRRLHEAWDACFEDNVFRNTCFQASLPARQAAMTEQLRSEFLLAAQSALPGCDACIEAGVENAAWEQVDTANKIVYVSICGRTEVAPPAFRCCGCSASFTVDPVSMGCFPATPQRPLVYYSGSLMQLTHQLSLASAVSMVAWTSTLEEVHVSSNCVPDEQLIGLPKQIWRNLPIAVRQWRRMDVATHDINRLGIQPISPEAVLSSETEDLEASQPPPQGSNTGQSTGLPAAAQADARCHSSETSTDRVAAGRETPAQDTCASYQVSRASGGPTIVCPGCWRTCVAANADACLGLTQLRAAGKASDFLTPKLPYSPFIANEETKALLAQRKDMDPAALERPVCSQFVAATPTASDTQLRLYVQVGINNAYRVACIVWHLSADLCAFEHTGRAGCLLFL